MPNGNVRKFYEFVNEHKEVAKKLQAVKSAEGILALAKENGFSFSLSEHESYLAGVVTKDNRLSDEEVDNVVGGFSMPGIMKFRAVCKTCGWKSDWYDVTAYENVGVIVGVHIAMSRHTEYDTESKMF